MKNLAMLPDYFDYIFVHLRQKVRLRPESSPKLLSSLSPNPARLTILVRKPEQCKYERIYKFLRQGFLRILAKYPQHAEGSCVRCELYIRCLQGLV